MATKLKIMTFNLRLATDADGMNSFTNRKPRISAFLKETNADVIGFQEITTTMREWLVEELSDSISGGDHHGFRRTMGRKCCMSLL